MSNKLKMKSNKKQNREAEVKANTTPWLIGLIAFAVVVVGLAIASSFVWGTQSLGSKKNASATEAVTTAAAQTEENAAEAATEAPADAQ